MRRGIGLRQTGATSHVLSRHHPARGRPVAHHQGLTPLQRHARRCAQRAVSECPPRRCPRNPCRGL
ncbi:MAG: hypothetical protein C0494_06655 [Sphingobium sp.]|nr:hypothetical protein [Sphingobium sp.]